MLESAKAKAAFAAYCDLGPARSLAKLAQKWGKSASYVGQLQRWSSQYRWVARASQYDEERRAEQERKKQAAIDAMNERHAMIGTSNQLRAIEQIERLIKAQKFGSQASVQLLKLAVETERLARGAPTERKEVTGKDGKPLYPDTDEVLGQFSDEEFEQLKLLRDKAQERIEQHGSSSRND